jgi:hypothetical protein
VIALIRPPYLVLFNFAAALTLRADFEKCALLRVSHLKRERERERERERVRERQRDREKERVSE